MKKHYDLLLLLLVATCAYPALGQQNNIGVNTATPHPSAALHVESTDKGVLIPRLSTQQREMIGNAAIGLLVFDTDTGSFWFYNGAAWEDLSAPDSDADPTNELQALSYDSSTQILTLENGGTVDLSGLEDSQAIVWEKNGNLISYNQGNVGVGISTPLAGLHLKEDRSLLIGTDTTGEGTKLLYLAGKGALRIGALQESGTTPELEANFWNRDSVGLYSFASGFNTKAFGDYSFVGGGLQNTASSYSFVGGGGGNTASGFAAFVGGGINNTASEFTAFVGGGENNTASGYAAFVGGGLRNTASGYAAFVGGGTQNTASGGSFIGGGFQNTTSKGNSFIGGGTYNIASGGVSFIGGGHRNTASGNYSFIGGGVYLSAPSYGEAVFGAYNEEYMPIDSADIAEADRLFVIGNGTDENNRSNAVTVLKNGQVGIGTSLPTAKLHIDRGSYPTAYLLRAESTQGVNQFNRYGHLHLQNATAADPGNYWHLAPRTSTRLEIGYGAPNENGIISTDDTKLSFETDGRVGIGKNAANTPGLLLDVDGDIYADGIMVSSDRRFKQNIKTIPEAMSKLSRLRGVSYLFQAQNPKGRRFTESPRLGLIAQEVETIFPELVATDEKGYKALNYDGLIPVLIEAVKEQQEQIEAQEESIRKLEARLAQLESNLQTSNGRK